MTPRLSIVVPTRNEERHIAACLAAFSTFGDEVERLVVDNSSPDCTREIAAAAGARVFIQGPERCAQRNRGWREAVADYVMFVDADMIVPEATTREILARLGSVDALYIREQRVGRGLRLKARNFERSFYNATCIDGLRVVRRRLLEQVGGYDENLVACEDWDLDRRLLSVGATTALTDGHLLHNEAQQSLSVFLRKKAYYSKSVAAYRAKWGDDAICHRQFGLAYRYWGVFVAEGRFRRVLAHPLLFVTMMLERIAVGIVYLLRR